MTNYIYLLKKSMLIMTLSISTVSLSQCVFIINPFIPTLLSPDSVDLPLKFYDKETSTKWQSFSCLPEKTNFSGEFSVFSLNGFVEKTKIRSIDTIHDGTNIAFDFHFLNDYNSKETMFAFKANWNPIPRKFQFLDPKNGLYEQAIKDILVQKKELKNSKVVIEKIIKVDLDGDNKDEVIIQASSHNEIYNVKGGDYSMVVLRRVVNEKVVTEIINFEESVVSTAEYIPSWMYVFSISGIIDLNGDGKMELIISTEGDHFSAITAYELCSLKLVAVLGWSIGD